MKKTYHLCLSGGDELLFRDQEDYNRGFNCFALALYKTGSTGLVESFMSTHCHLMAETEDPHELIYSMRMPYSKYFNYKYGRMGRLGEKSHFQIDVVGFYHKLSAACYTLRNAVHHGIAPIPYAYNNSTANSIFKQAKTALSLPYLKSHFTDISGNERNIRIPIKWIAPDYSSEKPCLTLHK